MVTTKYDITIQQGASFQRTIAALNQDKTVKSLVGYSARMQIRPTVGSATVLLDANTANGMLTVNGVAGTVSINVGADITTPMTWTTGVWDIEAYLGNTVIRLAEGFASLSQEVTR